MHKLSFEEYKTEDNFNFIDTKESGELISSCGNVFLFTDWCYLVDNKIVYKFKNKNYTGVKYFKGLLKLNDNYFKYENGRLNKTEETFTVKENALLLNDMEILINDKININNEIINKSISGGKYLGCGFKHEDDQFIVLSTTTSDTFMYIKNNKPMDLEEEDMLALRLDDNFDAVFINDLMFYNNRIILVDNKKTSVFTILIDDIPIKENEIEIKEITVEGDDNEDPIEMDLLKNIINKEKIEESDLFATNTKNIFGEKNNSSTSLFSGTISLATNTNNINIKPPVNSIKQEVIKEDDKAKKEEIEKQKIRVEMELKHANKQKLIDELQNDINYIKNCTLNQQIVEFDEFVVTNPHFDLSLLYKMIFDRNTDQYEKILSGMLVQVEEYLQLNTKNIEETIKHIDNKIFNKGRKPLTSVVYDSPLQGKDIIIDKSEDKLQNIIRGIKLLEIKHKSVIGEENKVKIVEKEVKETPEIKIEEKVEEEIKPQPVFIPEPVIAKEPEQTPQPTLKQPVFNPPQSTPMPSFFNAAQNTSINTNVNTSDLFANIVQQNNQSNNTPSNPFGTQSQPQNQQQDQNNPQSSFSRFASFNKKF